MMPPGATPLLRPIAQIVKLDTDWLVICAQYTHSHFAVDAADPEDYPF